MYYEEKYINGMWHYRRSLNTGKWKPMQHEHLNARITELKEQLVAVTTSLLEARQFTED